MDLSNSNNKRQKVTSSNSMSSNSSSSSSLMEEGSPPRQSRQPLETAALNGKQQSKMAVAGTTDKEEGEQIIASYLLEKAHEVISTSQGHLVTTFAKALGNSTVSIQGDAEPNGDIGTSYISVVLSSGDTIRHLDELFEPASTNVRALHASLAWCSTYLAAMVVKYLRMFSPEVITKLANARFIVWKVHIKDTEKRAILLMPKGELEHLRHKAMNKVAGSDEWIRQLVKPVQCYIQMEDGEWSMNRNTLVLEKNRRRVQEDTGLTPEEVEELIISPMQNLFCYFVKKSVLAKETEKEYYLKRLRGSNTCSITEQGNGLKQQSTSLEYWYFRKP